MGMVQCACHTAVAAAAAVWPWLAHTSGVAWLACRAACAVEDAEISALFVNENSWNSYKIQK